jgi:hypothetical protein
MMEFGCFELQSVINMSWSRLADKMKDQIEEKWVAVVQARMSDYIGGRPGSHIGDGNTEKKHMPTCEKNREQQKAISCIIGGLTSWLSVNWSIVHLMQNPPANSVLS